MTDNGDIKLVQITAAVTLNTGTTASITSAAVDTKGARSAFIFIDFGTIAGGGGLSVCKLQECATSGGTYTDVTGGSFGTVADTQDNLFVGFAVDMRGKQQFLKLVATTAGAVNTVVDFAGALLMKNEVAPPVDANRSGSILYV